MSSTTALTSKPGNYYSYLAIIAAFLAAMIALQPTATAFFHKKDEGKKLHEAAETGNVAVVQSLLKKGVNLNWSNEKGTALHRAAFHGHLSVVQMLLDAGADIDAKIETSLLQVMSKTSAEDRGKLSTVDEAFDATPLHVAVDRKQFEVAELLIKRGANVNANLTLGYDWSKKKNIKSVMDIAKMRSERKIVSLLRENGAK